MGVPVGFGVLQLVGKFVGGFVTVHIVGIGVLQLVGLFVGGFVTVHVVGLRVLQIGFLVGHRVGKHLIACGAAVNTFNLLSEEMSMALSTLSRHRERSTLMIEDMLIQ